MDNFLLIIGLSITGFTVGYMVGASATPVVSTAIPLLFGLIVVSFGMFQPNNHIKNLSSNLADNKELIQEIIKDRKKELSKTKKTIGFTLIFFSLFYLFGTFAGSYLRINGLFEDKTSLKFPWSEEDKPKNIKQAIYWINLQIKLNQLGYSDEKIKYLYKIKNNIIYPSIFDIISSNIYKDNNKTPTPVLMSLPPPNIDLPSLKRYYIPMEKK